MKSAAVLLRTARLELRPLRVVDAEEMAPVLADVGLYRFTGGAPPDVAALRERYVRQVVGRSPDGGERWLNWIVRLADDQSAVGYVQASLAGTVATIAWVIGAPWQRRGFAKEAARAAVAWLRDEGVTTIEANIAVGHLASQAVARGLGLARSGRTVDGEEVWSIGWSTPPL